MDTPSQQSSPPPVRPVRLSYKFQRLRERIRLAIDNGELHGKLPGERQLARKFKVNAKTLSKALTDLAAEGVLERNIGLGTFVRGTATVTPLQADRLLVLADAGSADAALLDHLSDVYEDVHVVTDPAALRPSLLQPHKRVLLLSTTLPETRLRGLIVRGMQIVRVGGETDSYSTHAVQVDRELAVARCVRQLAVAGRRHVLVIEPKGLAPGGPRDWLLSAARTAAEAVSIGLSETFGVQAGTTDDLVSAPFDAVICAAADAEDVLTRARRLGLTVPADLTVLGVGERNGPAACPGYYVATARLQEAVNHLFTETAGHKPVTLFLAPEYADESTTDHGAPPVSHETVGA